MSKNTTKTKNQNIQVAVRCRPLNGIEKRQGSCSILSCDRIKREVSVKEKGGVHPFTKTYNFDHVFGPDSLQVDVYKAVVKPVVEEVLTGYNCTIFAYGQTGTGKTFTMEGDRCSNASVSWEDDPLSGIIPRALHQVFDDLKKQPDVEFSLRVSFMELYNEELYDLLGSSLDPLKLRIYEDNSKKGSVIISGLEEVVVRTKEEVFEILQRGTTKRQTAATLMNDASSRSHSVFSVTIHIKENTLDGEELLKTGKLYLVDLAGSENIGRSGAVDKRAREAGNINQSLLTLGRVITSLVEHAPHIPYRESKLTRLLQDSLGGRTKTSIIATISPASVNFEETISTLDYAFRAKNITNRPEVNQKLTKKALLKEYTEEIERLRRDLQASREKNGIYIAQDNYAYIQNKLAEQTDSIQEYEDKLATLTQEMKTLTDMFNDTREELITTSDKLVVTSVKLDETSKELEITKVDLKETKQDRDEQQFLVTEHVKNESSLFGEAKELMTTVESSISDVEGLHDKVDRKKAVEDYNQDALTVFRDSLSQHVSDMDSKMDKLNDQNSQFVCEISKCIDGSMSEHTKSVGDVKNMVNGMEKLVAGTSVDLIDMAKQQNGYLKQFAGNLEDNIETMRMESMVTLNETSNKMVTTLDNLKEMSAVNAEAVSVIHRALEEQEEEHAQLLNGLVENLKTMMADIVQVANSFINRQADENKRLREEAEETSLKMTEYDEQLLSYVASISSMVQKKRERFGQHTDHVTQYSSQHSAQMASFQTELKRKEHEVPESCCENSKKITNFMQKACQAQRESLHKTHNSLIEFGKEANNVSSMTKEYSAQAQQNWDKSSESLKAELNEMINNSESRFTSSQGLIESLDSDFKERSSSTLDAVAQSEKSMRSSFRQQKDFYKSHNSIVEAAVTDQKSQIKNTVNMFNQFIDNEYKKDIPTGCTPQRTVFYYPRNLTKTEQHQNLLEQFRMKQDEKEATVTELETLIESKKDDCEDVKDIPDDMSDAGTSIASTSGISVSSSISKISELDVPKENEPRTKKIPINGKKNQPKTPSRTFKKPTTTTSRAKRPLLPSNRD